MTVQTHLWVLASQMSVHGSAGGHLGPTEVARLGLHLLVSQVDVLLQHVLCQVLLVARLTGPCLTHCGEKEGNWGHAIGTDGNNFLSAYTDFLRLSPKTAKRLSVIARVKTWLNTSLDYTVTKIIKMECEKYKALYSLRNQKIFWEIWLFLLSCSEFEEKTDATLTAV